MGISLESFKKIMKKYNDSIKTSMSKLLKPTDIVGGTNITTTIENNRVVINNDINTDTFMEKDVYTSTEHSNSVKYADRIYDGESQSFPCVYGKDQNGNLGFYTTLPELLPEQSNYTFKINNVVANNMYNINSKTDLTNIGVTVQVFKSIQGLQDILSDIVLFNTDNIDAFYHDRTNITIDGNLYIKNSLILTPSVNDINMYETEIINKNDFINGFEVSING